MLIRKPSDIPGSEITSEETYRHRRAFMVAGAGLIAVAALGLPKLLGGTTTPGTGEKLGTLKKSSFSTSEPSNSFKEISTYNNFYEFGTSKEDPARNAHTLRPRPWTLKIEGECLKPRTFSIDDLLKLAPLEERIYRMRCVEGWSMVIPWVGYPLKALLDLVQPKSTAAFVEFSTLMDPKQMPGQASRALNWPYKEGLRLDEANHPLCILGLGLYGQTLPNQNGAPVRLVVPWKYGFKGAKSIVNIRLVKSMPRTAWNDANPSEYGFYSNVNPGVDHPRWSQATERRIGEFKKRPTQMFNGYGDQVAALYAGLDLKRNF